jgi:RNA polymerase II subunit A-like phosphatase
VAIAHSLSSEPWQTAETFGAIVSNTITPATTHCVTATLGTEKTYRANKMGVMVVWMEWFLQSTALWARQDEERYRAIKPGSGTGSGEGSRAASRPGSGTVTPMDVEGGDDSEHRGDIGGSSGGGKASAPAKGSSSEATRKQSVAPLERAVEGEASAATVDRGDGADEAGDAELDDEESEPDQDLDFGLGEWDEEADEEWKAFMEGDGGSEAVTEDVDGRSEAGER